MPPHCITQISGYWVVVKSISGSNVVCLFYSVLFAHLLCTLRSILNDGRGNDTVLSRVSYGTLEKESKVSPQDVLLYC